MKHIIGVVLSLLLGITSAFSTGRLILAAPAGGGSFSNTLTYQNSIYGAYSTNYSFTAVPIGTASADRIISVIAMIDSNSITGVTICGVTGTPFPGNQVAPIFAGGWYANVTSGTTCTITVADTAVKDMGISVWSLHGQTGGASATPSSSLTLNTSGAEPVPISETVSAGGTADIMAYCSNATTNALTWSNAAVVGTNILTGAGGTTPVLSSAQATTSATVTATTTGGSGGHCSYGDGWLGYASWGP